MFSDRTHSAPSLTHDPLPCRTEPLQASSQAARDGDRQFCHCCFPRVLHSKERGRVTKYLDPRNVRTPRSKYFKIFGPPLKYLDPVRSACCSRVVNCTKNGRPRSPSPESPPATHPPPSPENPLAPSQTPSRETTPHDNLDDSVSPLPPPLPPLTLYMDTSNNKVKLYCVHLDSIQL